MPASNTTFLGGIFSWFRGTTATPVPPTPIPTPTIRPSVSPPAVPPPASVVPSLQPELPRDVLPTEGPNLDFRRIWHNHPTISEGEVFPCRDEVGVPHFDNQCAILMGTCLLRSELLHGYDKPMCWYRGHKGHTLRAREVADWMRRHPERFGRAEVRSNISWGAFKGRTGFICFHNFWGAGNQGDHIDLWDGTGIIRRETDPSLEGPGLADGSLDYFERSEEVWFWPIH